MKAMRYGIGWRWMTRSLSFFLVLTATGCGKATSTVSGQVTRGNKPLTGGVVIILTEDDKAFDGPIDAQGNYSIPNVPRGQVRIGVQVSARALTPDNAAAKEKMGPPKGALPEGVPNPYANVGKASRTEDIPYKYKDPKTSGLTFTVSQPNETYNIQIP